jgi:hypothetical protein
VLILFLILKLVLINLKLCIALLTWDPRLIVKMMLSGETEKCILFANRCFHGLRKHFKSQLISRKAKMTLYKVLVRPVVTYATETWTLTKADERALGLFERKILRSVFGALRDKGQWRRRYNFELYKLCDGPHLVKYIRFNTLKWAGHVMRMDNNRITKRMFNTRPEGKIGTGRPKLRWGG